MQCIGQMVPSWRLWRRRRFVGMHTVGSNLGNLYLSWQKADANKFKIYPRRRWSKNLSFQTKTLRGGKKPNKLTTTTTKRVFLFFVFPIKNSQFPLPSDLCFHNSELFGGAWIALCNSWAGSYPQRSGGPGLQELQGPFPPLNFGWYLSTETLSIETFQSGGPLVETVSKGRGFSHLFSVDRIWVNGQLIWSWRRRDKTGTGVTTRFCPVEYDVSGQKHENGVRDGGKGQAEQGSQIEDQPCSCVSVILEQKSRLWDKNIVGDDLYQISWHSWKRQRTAGQATCMPTCWWFTHVHQVEIIPLPSDFIAHMFKELCECPITSEMTLWHVQQPKLVIMLCLSNSEHSSSATCEALTWSS